MDTAQVKMGSDFFLTLLFAEPIKVGGIQLGVAIRDDKDDFVAHFTTEMSWPECIDDNKGAQWARAKLEKICLVPGYYSLDFAVFRTGSSPLDHVQRVLRFEVLEADVYGTGFQVTPSHGKVFLRGCWELGYEQSGSQP